MIACIHGEILAIQGQQVVVMTSSGIGYEIKVSDTYTHGEGDMVTLFVWTVFNEGRHEDVMYGFESADERELARLAADTDGVGPGKAHALVACAGVPMVLRGVRSGDVEELLEYTTGIGRKTLVKIVQTLKAKGDFADAFADPRTSHVRMALGSLGHEVMELDQLMGRILSENPGAAPEVIVRILLGEIKKK